MKQSPTLAQLVNSIADAHATGNSILAHNLFLELYSRVRDHFFKSYCAVLFAAFKTTGQSLRAEQVFQEIVNEIEREIQQRKFEVSPDTSDAVVRKRLLKRVGIKAYSRTINAMKRWKRNPTFQSADLAPYTMEQIADVSDFNSDEEEETKQGVDFVLANLPDRDADILRTLYYSTLNRAEAEQLLMERYDLTESALNKATWRAKKLFKTIWKQFLSQKYSLKSTNTNLKLQT